MNDLYLFFGENNTVIIGAIAGVLSTVVVRFVTFRYRMLMAAIRFRRDISGLSLHISASVKSLNFDPGRAKYFIAARLRYCKFLDRMASVDDLGWLSKKRDSKRILPFLILVRNSDTFIEEIACRIDDMSFDECREALEEAKLNLVILSEAVRSLGYKIDQPDIVFNGEFAEKTLKKLNRNADGTLVS